MYPVIDAARSALSARLRISQIFENLKYHPQIFENRKSPESRPQFRPSQKSRVRTPWLPPSGPPEHEDTPIDVLPTAVDDVNHP